jgi:hypothetical protein
MGGYTSKCEKNSKSLHPNVHTVESGFDNCLITLSWWETNIILLGKQTSDRRLWSVSLIIKKNL